MAFSCLSFPNWTSNRGDFMTLADIIILVVVVSIIALILFHQFKKKDEGMCTRCSYAKTCSKDNCFPTKKSD